MSFTEVSKSAAPSFSTTSKNSSPFTLFIKHGKNPLMSELADFTFESVVLEDGTKIKDVTFAQLADLTWTLVNKS